MIRKSLEEEGEDSVLILYTAVPGFESVRVHAFSGGRSGGWQCKWYGGNTDSEAKSTKKLVAVDAVKVANHF